MNDIEETDGLIDACRRFRAARGDDADRQAASIAHLEACDACEAWLTERLRSIAAAATSEPLTATVATVTPAQAVWRARNPRPAADAEPRASSIRRLRPAALLAVLGAAAFFILSPRAPAPETPSLLARVPAPPSEVWLFPLFEDRPAAIGGIEFAMPANPEFTRRDDLAESPDPPADLASALHSSGRLCAALDRSLPDPTDSVYPWNLEGGL